MAAYFSHPSYQESDAAAAVEAIISQAADLCDLEQIAALNTSHLSDSSLPTDVEARFRKLKSFPGANPRPRTPPRCIDTNKENIPRSPDRYGSKRPPASPPDAKPDQPMKSEATSPAKPYTLKDSEPKARSGFSLSPSISHRDSPSPPRQVGCFGCYPKRAQRKKGRSNGSGFDVGDWGTNDDILSDLKDQQRKLKKMLKGQEKVSREAEKVVELVKQASARMNVATVDELLSEDEEFK